MKDHDILSRRNFFGKSALMLAAAGTFSTNYAIDKKAAQARLTVIAYNVYKCNGWPKDNKWAVRARDEGQMLSRLAQELALYEPDIITFSESPGEAAVHDIAKRLRMNYVFFPSAGNWPGALLTRLPIEGSGNVPLKGERPSDLFTRHWGKTILKLSNGWRVCVHSAHLFPHDTPEAGLIREQEIAEIVETITADLANGYSIIIMGDLNHTPGMPEYRQWINAGCVDTFAKVGKGDGATIRSDRPERRIDYVLTHGLLRETIVESRPLFERNFRTNLADPNSFALSDHLPQLAVFVIP